MQRLATLAVVAVIIALTSCSSSQQSTVSPAQADQLLGLDLTPAQNTALETANQEIVRKCMSQQGFTYYVESQDSDQTEYEATGTGLPLVSDLTKLRKYGYGIYQATLSSGPQSTPGAKNLAYENGLTPARKAAYQNAFEGNGNQQINITLPDGHQTAFSVGGCRSQADASEYGDLKTFLTIRSYAEDLQAKINDSSAWQKSWTIAEGKWAQCMKQHGIFASSETSAQLLVANRYQDDPADLVADHEYELQVGRQDADCSAALNLNAAAKSSVESALASLTSDEINAMLAWEQMQQHAVSVAQRILAEG